MAGAVTMMAMAWLAKAKAAATVVNCIFAERLIEVMDYDEIIEGSWWRMK